MARSTPSIVNAQEDTYNLDNKTRQKEIADWFNRTYSLRGEMYLRPVKAYYIFLELLKVKSKESILDVACGLGRLLEAGRKYNLDLNGIDISEVAISKAKLKVPEAKVEVGNAEELTYADATFDYITCLGSLERMIDLPKVLAEMQRVSKPNAKFCFLVRNIDGLSWQFVKKGLGLVNKKGHQGAKSREEWESIFDQAGFQQLAIYPDQYPIKKRELITTLGLKKIDYFKISKGIVPLKNAHEFIFILEKKS